MNAIQGREGLKETMTNGTSTETMVSESRWTETLPAKLSSFSPEGKENTRSVSKQYRCQKLCPYDRGDGKSNVTSTMRVINGKGTLYASEVMLIPSWNSGFNRRLQQLKMKEKRGSKQQGTVVDNAACSIGNTNHKEKDYAEESDQRRVERDDKTISPQKIPKDVVEESSVQELSIEGTLIAKKFVPNIPAIKTHALSAIEIGMKQKQIPKIPASIIMEVVGSFVNDRKLWNSLACLSKETYTISNNRSKIYRPWPSIRWRATTTTAKCGLGIAVYQDQRRIRRNARGAVQTSARPRTVAFGDEYLCYGTDRGEVLVRNRHGHGSINVRRGHRGCVDSVKCCGNWLFSAGDDLMTKIWNVTTMSCEAILDDHLDNITSIDILPFGGIVKNLHSSRSPFSCMLVSTAGLDGNVHLYAIYCEGKNVLHTKHIAVFAEEGFPKQTHSVVLFEKDGQRRLVSGGQDGRLRLWDVDAAIDGRIKGDYSDIESETIASRITDNICIYRYDGEIKSIAISRDKERIAAAFGRTICHSYLSGKTLENYDFLHHHDHNHRFRRRLEEQRRFRNEGQTPQSVSTCSVTGTEEDHWKVLKGHSGDIRCIDFSPDGKTVASACSDGSIRLWQLGEGTWKRKWKAHNGFMVRSLAVSPDGQSLLSAGSDGTIAIERLFP